MTCACGCGTVLTGRQRKWAPGHAPNVFADDYRPYGTYTGKRGDPGDWRNAFEQRFSKAEIKQYLGGDTAWDVLGIAPGSDEATIKRAYRRLARDTHPDLHPGIDRALFQKVQAAYQSLMNA